MTGKQVWERFEEIRKEQRDWLRGLSDDDLRHALGYGVMQAPLSEVAAMRVRLRREMRRRNLRIPEELE